MVNFQLLHMLTTCQLMHTSYEMHGLCNNWKFTQHSIHLQTAHSLETRFETYFKLSQNKLYFHSSSSYSCCKTAPVKMSSTRNRKAHNAPHIDSYARQFSEISSCRKKHAHFCCVIGWWREIRTHGEALCLFYT